MDRSPAFPECCRERGRWLFIDDHLARTNPDYGSRALTDPCAALSECAPNPGYVASCVIGASPSCPTALPIECPRSRIIDEFTCWLMPITPCDLHSGVFYSNFHHRIVAVRYKASCVLLCNGDTFESIKQSAFLAIHIINMRHTYSQLNAPPV